MFDLPIRLFLKQFIFFNGYMEKHDKGKAGELMAAEFLSENGYRILQKNWRVQHLEIDIIVENDDYVVIVEVKTRNSRDFGDPYEFVSRKKQSLLVKAAQFYAEKFKIEKEIRFDVVAIIINENGAELEHIPFAFTPLIGM